MYEYLVVAMDHDPDLRETEGGGTLKEYCCLTAHCH